LSPIGVTPAHDLKLTSQYPNLYYRWSKDFLEAGKRRLSGDTGREANTDEVTGLKHENKDLKQAVAELYLRNDWLKKSLTGQGVTLDDE
jgi:transposase